MPTFERHDPGVESFLNADLRGLPAYLDLTVHDLGAGRMRCDMDVRDELLNPFGSLHGGVISSIVDHVLGSVCYPVIERGAWAATTEFKLNLLAPVRGGTLTATAEIVSMSKRVAVVRIDVDNNGTLVAAAQGTVTIMPPRT